MSSTKVDMDSDVQYVPVKLSAEITLQSSHELIVGTEDRLFCAISDFAKKCNAVVTCNINFKFKIKLPRFDYLFY